VKAAARLRILALVDPALATLARAVNGKGQPTAVEISAAKDILDRAGLAEKEAEGGGATTIELVLVQAGQQIQGPAVEVRAIREA
jgi:hypothetical protein